MKRKRGRTPAGKKAAPAAAAEESPSPDSPSSPSTEATNSTPDQAEEDSAPPATQAPVPAPAPPPAVAPPPPSEPPHKPAAAAPVNPLVDIPYAKPKVGAVYGRVKLKFKSSKAVDPPQLQQGSSGAQAPAADAAKSKTATVPEVVKEAEVEKAAVLTDRQQGDGQGSETSDADKEKVVRKVGGIKIKSAGLASVGNNTPDRKGDPVDEPPPSKQAAVSENKGSEETVEPRSSQESEEKQSTPERQRDEKELAAALEVSRIWLTFFSSKFYL